MTEEWRSGNICYDLKLYDRVLMKQPTHIYIACLEASKACSYGPGVHTHHEYPDGFTWDHIPKIQRSPCVQVAITLAKVGALLEDDK